jgi:hypothetical protein
LAGRFDTFYYRYYIVIAVGADAPIPPVVMDTAPMGAPRRLQ